MNTDKKEERVDLKRVLRCAEALERTDAFENTIGRSVANTVMHGTAPYVRKLVEEVEKLRATVDAPVVLILYCPKCSKQHIDQLEEDGTDWSTRAHRKHLCKNTPDGPDTGCGHVWKPSDRYTVGVRFLP